jgi:hypothetical protein
MGYFWWSEGEKKNNNNIKLAQSCTVALDIKKNIYELKQCKYNFAIAKKN